MLALMQVMVLAPLASYMADARFLPQSHGVDAAARALLSSSKSAGTCDGLDSMVIADPSTCERYYICCQGTPVSARCGRCNPQYPVCEYSPVHLFFDGETSQCMEWDQRVGSFRCEQTSQTYLPVWTPSAEQFCRAAAAGGQVGGGFVRAVSQDPVDSYSEEQGKAVQTRSAATDTWNAPSHGTVAADHGFCPALGAAAPGPEQIGRYELIVNSATGQSNSGTIAMHVVLVPNTSLVLLWSRHLAPSATPPPGMERSVAALFDPEIGMYTPKPVAENPFCSGHSFLSDGTIVAAGGEMPGRNYSETPTNDWLLEGRDRVRIFNATTLQWTTLPVVLKTMHWYPTQLTLSDQRVLVSGGYYHIQGPGNGWLEILDFRSNPPAVVSQVDPFLDGLAWDNLYPSLHLLPGWAPAGGAWPQGTQYVLQYSCYRGEATAITLDNRIQKVIDLPPLRDATGTPQPNWCAATSSTGASLILPLRPDTGAYVPEFMMFGGHTSRNNKFPDPANPANTITWDWCPAPIPALDLSFRLALNPQRLASPNPADVATYASGLDWQVEAMPVKRNQGAAVLLPNGKVLLVNGNQYGKAGGGLAGYGNANTPTHNAVLYDPDKPAGQRYSCLAGSPIKRFYHNSALLLPDGDVLVAGNEHDEPLNYWCDPPASYLAEFRAERFKLPYAFAPERPTIQSSPDAPTPLGYTVQVAYTGRPVDAATLVAPGAMTHSLDMNQRVIFLQVLANTYDPRASQGSMTLRLPCPQANVANPGMWMLFLLAGDVPSKRAAWLRLTLPSQPWPDCTTAGPSRLEATLAADPPLAHSPSPLPSPSPETRSSVSLPPPAPSPGLAGHPPPPTPDPMTGYGYSAQHLYGYYSYGGYGYQAAPVYGSYTSGA